MFDSFKSEDILMAFFPCVRFENQIMLSFRGQSHGMEKWTYRQKMQHCMKLLSEVKHNYDIVNKMFIVCMDRGVEPDNGEPIFGRAFPTQILVL